MGIFCNFSKDDYKRRTVCLLLPHSPTPAACSPHSFIFFSSSNQPKNTHNHVFPLFAKFLPFSIDLNSTHLPLSIDTTHPPFFFRKFEIHISSSCFLGLILGAPKLPLIIVSLMLQTAFHSVLVYLIFENRF